MSKLYNYILFSFIARSYLCNINGMKQLKFNSFKRLSEI